MSVLRRILGILVMIAGLLGLVLSLAGLVGVWMAKPTVTQYLTTTVSTLNNSITTSQHVMEVTRQALRSTVDSVDAMSVMLGSTATSVQDTQPVVGQVNILMGQNLPNALRSATDSLKSAQQAADVMDGAVRSLQAFQAVMGSVPLISSFVPPATEPYNPQVPLSESLGQVAANLEDLPAMMEKMAADLDKADNNMVTIQTSLTTMSTSVKGISASLTEYENMVAQSETSMGNLAPMLANIQANLNNIVNGVVWVLTAFLVWLLVIQVVIFSQGYELYQGTAGRMEGKPEQELAGASPAV